MAGPSLAVLGIEVKSDGVARARDELGRFVGAGIKAEKAAAGLEVATDKTERAAGRLTRRMALAEIEARRMDAAMGGAGRSSFRLAEGATSLGSALQAVAGALAIREVIALADAYTGLHARLSLVTTSAQNLAKVEGELFAMSQQTRTGLEPNVALYSALARSTKSLGLSQADLLQVTKTVAQSFVISGASASETNSAVRQLSQAFASGVLRGDEFNSIAENAPRLQNAVAASLHITIGELRTMAEQGQLTGRVLAKALLDQSKEIAAEFDKMPVTVAQAMVRIHNAILVAVGAVNSAQGSTAGLAGALTDVANAIPVAGSQVNSFFAGWALAATDAAISVERLKLAMKIDAKQTIAGMISAATGNYKGALLAGVSIANRDTAGTSSALDALLAERERQATALAAGGGLNAGGAATPTGPTKAERQAAEKEFQRVLRDRITAQRAAVREAEKEYRHGVDEAIRGLKEIEAEEDRQHGFAMMQYNEQAKAAQKAYQDEVDAALRAFKLEEKYRDDMRKEWRRGLDQILNGGLQSWSGFFNSVFGLFRRLMDRMEAAGKDNGKAYKALGLGASAIAGGVAGFGIGQQLFSTSHGAAGNNLRGALGGAGAGAAAGFAIAGPAGAAVGAVAGLVGGIIGIGSASKAAAKAMAEAVAQVTLSMAALRATVKGDTLAQGIAAIEADRAQRAKAIEEAWSGGDANSDRVRWRTQQHKELNALEDERIRQLREEYALAQARAAEDLQVRLLTAQGRNEEARTLALQLAQERERQTLIKSFGESIDPVEQATLSLLNQMQAQEKLKAATDAANGSALNMVDGYKALQSHIFAAMSPRSSIGGQYAPIASPFRAPSGPATGGDLAVTVMVPNGEVLGKTVIRDFARRKRLGDADLGRVLS